YCKNRCAIDHYAVKQLCSLSNQLPEEWTGKNLSRLGRTSSACEDRKLASRRGKNFPSQLNVLVDKLDFPGGNHARCRNQVHFTDQTIRHTRWGVFLGIVAFVGGWEAKDLVHVRPTQVAVNQEYAITLLGQCKRIIGACETFTFVGHSTGEKRNLALGFRTQQRKRSAQIAKRFRRRTFRSFHHHPVV